MNDRHVWKVVMRNDVKGFSRTFYVEAYGPSQAMTFVADELRAKGYKPADFNAIEIVRRRKVA